MGLASMGPYIKPYRHQEGPMQNKKEFTGSVQLFQLEFLDSEVFI